MKINIEEEKREASLSPLKQKKMARGLCLLFCILCCCGFTGWFHQESSSLWAAETTTKAQTALPETTSPAPDSATPKLITQLSVLAALSLLPFAVMLLTSYVKVVIVLSLLRNALGVQQSPPNQVLNGIALLVTVYVMFPTGVAMYNAAGDYMKKNAPETLFTGPTAGYILTVADKAKEPLRQFLQKNCIHKNMISFYQLAQRNFPEPYKTTMKPNDFIVLIPAFITSQLKAAFEIGVLIYLPFFVIDLVTSNILLAMGMMMLSPLTIALPLKLLLLVMVDGWTIIIQGLTMSFRT